MASLSKDNNGWRILFVCPTTRKRRTIRTGRCAKKNAETARNMVEGLLEVKALGSAIDQQTAAWLDSIDGKLKERLVKAGLAEGTTATLLGPFLDGFIDQRRRRGDVTESTLTVWGHTRRNLLAFFGENKGVQAITPGEADEWAAWLREDQGLAENTIRKRSQFAKMLFKAALRRKLIAENPFAGLVSRTVPASERQFFIFRETVTTLLDQCRGPEYRLLLIFARYMGVRVPSEIVPLKWSDVDWSKSLLIITSPKTQRHKGGDKRVCPLFPEVQQALQEAWDAAPEGAVYIFPSIRSNKKNLRAWLQRAILRSGLKSWPRLWQNFRATRATELADEFPSHVAAAWLGHTEQIADGHYRQVTTDHYERATTQPTGVMPGQGESPKEDLAQIPAHSSHVTANHGTSRKTAGPTNPEIDEACCSMNTPLVEDRGLEPLTF